MIEWIKDKYNQMSDKNQVRLLFLIVFLIIVGYVSAVFVSAEKGPTHKYTVSGEPVPEAAQDGIDSIKITELTNGQEEIILKAFKRHNDRAESYSNIRWKEDFSHTFSSENKYEEFSKKTVTVNEEIWVVSFQREYVPKGELVYGVDRTLDIFYDKIGTVGFVIFLTLNVIMLAILIFINMKVTHNKQEQQEQKGE